MLSSWSCSRGKGKIWRHCFLERPHQKHSSQYEITLFYMPSWSSMRHSTAVTWLLKEVHGHRWVLASLGTPGTSWSWCWGSCMSGNESMVACSSWRITTSRMNRLIQRVRHSCCTNRYFVVSWYTPQKDSQYLYCDRFKGINHHSFAFSGLFLADVMQGESSMKGIIFIYILQSLSCRDHTWHFKTHR